VAIYGESFIVGNDEFLLFSHAYLDIKDEYFKKFSIKRFKHSI